MNTMSTATITPTEAALDTAASRMWDLIDGGQWNQLRREILTDGVFAIRVALELKRGNDSFDDFGSEVAEWVREANPTA